MSEHQIVAFRAIDGPVGTGDLEYMRKQSSRARITPWSFDNEYHFGDFGGNSLEMLRRGYDVHLHYADFGIRKLLIRYPFGLPNAAEAELYFNAGALEFVEDKKGPGGTLSIQPSHEPGDLDGLWEFDELLDRLLPLRAELLAGDLRPLYLAHLAIACDNEHDPELTTERPVPAGLGQLSDAQRALAELYGLSGSLVAAAAQESPPLATQDDPQDSYPEWLRGQSQTIKDAWLAQLMSQSHATVRNQILAEFKKSRREPVWPTVRRDRTISSLLATAEAIDQKADRKKAEGVARERTKRLAEIATNPTRTLRETEELAKQRSKAAYTQISTLLAELRESQAGTDQSEVAEQQAQKLNRENPTLRTLVSELRKEGFLTK